MATSTNLVSHKHLLFVVSALKAVLGQLKFQCIFSLESCARVDFIYVFGLESYIQSAAFSFAESATINSFNST